MIVAIEWITGILTVIVFYLMGSKWKYSPIIGIICQGFWIAFVIMTKSWGIGVASLFILGVHIRNSFLWLKKGNKKC